MTCLEVFLAVCSGEEGRCSEEWGEWEEGEDDEEAKTLCIRAAFL